MTTPRAKRSKPKGSTSKPNAKAKQAKTIWPWLLGATTAAVLLGGLLIMVTRSGQPGATPKPDGKAAADAPVADPNTPQPVFIQDAYTLKRPPQNNQSTAPDKLKSEGIRFSGSAFHTVARADGDRLTGGAHMFLFDAEAPLALTWIGHCGVAAGGDGSSDKVQFQYWDGVMFRSLKPDAETSRPVGKELLREYTLTLPAGQRGQRCLIVSAYKARLAEPGVPNFYPIISELIEARTVPAVKD